MDNPKSEIHIDRRNILKGGAAAGLSAFLAGCMGGDNGDSDDGTGGNNGTSSDGGDSSSGQSKPDKLTISIPAEVKSLDPSAISTSYGREWAYSVYSGLIKIDYDQEADELVYGVPDLAEEWDWVEQDGENLVQITLRDDVQFHNGDDLDAQLVKDELDYWFEENTQTGQDFGQIQQVSMDNDRTVNLHFGDEPWSPFEFQFNGLIGNPYVREELGQGQFASTAHGGGSGPYQIAEYESGSRLLLERYDDYHEDGLPHFEEVEVRILPESSTRMAQLQAGDLHLDSFVDAENYTSLEGTNGLETVQSPATLAIGTLFNQEKNEAFRDSRVRRALSMAIDRQAFGEATVNGIYEPISLPSLPEMWWYFEELNQKNLYNPERAQELLAEAGYENGFEMTIQHGSGTWHQTIAQVTQSMYEEVGVDVTLEPMEQTTLWTEIASGNYEAATSEMVGRADPDFWLYNYCHPDGSWSVNTNGWENYIAEENREIFDLFEQQRAETDRETRVDLLEQIYEIFSVEMPYNFHVNMYNLNAHVDDLEGYWTPPGDASAEALRQVNWN